MRKVVVKMIKLLDKMFDSFLYWLERVQWNRDSRRRKRKYKKQSKENSKIQDRLKNAEKQRIKAQKNDPHTKYGCKRRKNP